MLLTQTYSDIKNAHPIFRITKRLFCGGVSNGVFARARKGTLFAETSYKIGPATVHCTLQAGENEDSWKTA